MDAAGTGTELALAITAARDRLVLFATQCPPDAWDVAVLGSTGDPRPLGVVVDHVGHAYEYLARFIADIVAGESPAIDAGLIDAINAEHATASAATTRRSAVERLARSGDELAALVGGLSDDQLDLMEGRVRRLAAIGARHADDHRAELVRALAAT